MFLNKLELICLLINIDIVSSQSNGYNYCHLELIIQYNINHLFAESEVITSIAISYNNSIQHYSFVWTQLNDSTYSSISLTIQLDMSFVYIQINGHSSIFNHSI